MLGSYKGQISTLGALLLSVSLFQNCDAKHDRAGAVAFAGYQGDGRGNDTPGVLLNNKWFNLSSRKGEVPLAGWAIAPVFYSDDFYIGGSVQGPTDSTFYAGYWKNGKWTDVEQGRDGQIEALLVVEKTVYAGGLSPYSEDKPAAWVDGKKIELEMGGETRGRIQKILKTASAVIAIGRRGPIAGFWSMTTGAWNTVELSSFNSSATYKGSDIFVGTAGSTSHPAFVRDNILTSLSNNYGEATDIFVFNGEFYISGYIAVSPSSPFTEGGYWKNGSWVKVNVDLCVSNFGSGYSSSIEKIELLEGDLILIGSCREGVIPSTKRSIRFYIKNGVTTVLNDMQNGALQFFAGSDID